MRLIVLIALFVPLCIIAQTKVVYVKFESAKKTTRVSTVYVSGQKNVISYTLSIPTKGFYPFQLYDCVPIEVIVDGSAMKSFQTLGFLCGDSVILNVDNGYSKVINRSYSEYEQNYWFYLYEYFGKK